LLVEQVLEIIFTFFTVKVDWVAEEDPAPAEPVPLFALEEPLGLLAPEADELLSVPITRT
jgi:hypothetical protein